MVISRDKVRPILVQLLFIFLSPLLEAQQDPLQSADSLNQHNWVEAHYNAMTLEERIGQLFMVMAASSDQNAQNQVAQWIKDYKIGGVVFSTGGPIRQGKLSNALQEISKTPLLIAMDAEWGLAMRLDSTYAFPWNTTLGAIGDSAVLEQVGYQIGKHARRMGVHLNFAPVADVNINPNNPIIGNRSFGEDPKLVLQHARQVMQGMHRAGILTSAKHFPGHGDTATDSHHALPVLAFSRKRLDTIELMPFKGLINAGLPTVMIAHLAVPALTGAKLTPTSLSDSLIQKLLKRDYKFKGLILTDALNMKGVSSSEQHINTSLAAFIAGNDMLLMPNSLKADRDAILEAYHGGIISEERLAHSVKKVLKAKYKAGLHAYKPIDLNNLVSNLNTSEDDIVYERAMEEAITVLKNDENLLGLTGLEKLKIGYLALGPSEHESFLEHLRLYAQVDEIKGEDLHALEGNHNPYNLFVVGIHQPNENPWKSHKLSKSEIEALARISALPQCKTVLTIFAKPYLLEDISGFEDFEAVMLAYQNSRISQETAAELIFGVFSAQGKIPVTAHPLFPMGTGLKTKALGRLGYSVPERVQLDGEKLMNIDALVSSAIDSLYFPGAQVLVARHGQVIYHKGFGKVTYEDQQKVTINHLYDLASLTKILATLPVLMDMEEQRELALNNTFADLSPEFAQSPLRDVTVLKALSHYGRLPAWIPFYLYTLGPDRQPSTDLYSKGPSENYSIQVADQLFLAQHYSDSIYARISRQPLKSNRYRYSDLAYYIFKKYIEQKRKQSLDIVVDSFLLQPIGASRATFNPLKKFQKTEIIPSEVDAYYRHQKVHGFVHDMGAAMQGGVGGHAGLFANANDVGKIMQMYLQGGYYGGRRYLEERTVEKFNKCYFCNFNVRRGVGFDKPDLSDRGPTCKCVSRKSFGHSGFTGTYTWADPASGILYVFLSNRTYPSATNNLLIRSQLRTRIQEVIYDSISL